MNKNINQSGFTIVELLVAATLGVMILGAAVSMFSNNKRLYQSQDEMGRLQENARFALNIMINDLRMVGHVGCHGDANLVYNHLKGVTPGWDSTKNLPKGGNFASPDPTGLFAFQENLLIEGSNNKSSWFPSASTEEVSGMVASSDAITIRYLEPVDFYLMDNGVDQTAETIKVSSNSGLDKGHVVALSDCNGSDMIQITKAPTTTGCGVPARNSTGPTDTCYSTVEFKDGTIAGVSPGNEYSALSHDYNLSNEAKFLRARTNRYFIGLDGDGNHALFRKSNDDSAEPIVDGVENMQVLYGEDTDGDLSANSYLAANAVSNWGNVVSVQIGLLVRTPDEYGPDVDNDTYRVLDELAIDPANDRRQRRVVSTTIQLRNRNI